MTASNRADILTTALGLVNADRNNTYGEPVDDYTKVAGYWNTYLDGLVAKRGSHRLEPHDAVTLMILLKIARIGNDPDHKDNWIDIAGYAACGFDARSDLLERRSTPEDDDQALWDDVDLDEPIPYLPVEQRPINDEYLSDEAVSEELEQLRNGALRGHLYRQVSGPVLAFQWTGDNTDDVVQWLRDGEARTSITASHVIKELYLSTPNGEAIVKPGDWLVIDNSTRAVQRVKPEHFLRSFAAYNPPLS